MRELQSFRVGRIGLSQSPFFYHGDTDRQDKYGGQCLRGEIFDFENALGEDVNCTGPTPPWSNLWDGS